jgi:hypothetical protein
MLALGELGHGDPMGAMRERRRATQSKGEVTAWQFCARGAKPFSQTSNIGILSGRKGNQL